MRVKHKEMLAGGCTLIRRVEAPMFSDHECGKVRFINHVSLPQPSDRLRLYPGAI